MVESLIIINNIGTRAESRETVRRKEVLENFIG
jgi:hypothetical protein